MNWFTFVAIEVVVGYSFIYIYDKLTTHIKRKWIKICCCIALILLYSMTLYVQYKNMNMTANTTGFTLPEDQLNMDYKSMKEDILKCNVGWPEDELYDDAYEAGYNKALYEVKKKLGDKLSNKEIDTIFVNIDL